MTRSQNDNQVSPRRPRRLLEERVWWRLSVLLLQISLWATTVSAVVRNERQLRNERRLQAPGDVVPYSVCVSNNTASNSSFSSPSWSLRGTVVYGNSSRQRIGNEGVVINRNGTRLVYRDDEYNVVVLALQNDTWTVIQTIGMGPTVPGETHGPHLAMTPSGHRLVAMDRTGVYVFHYNSTLDLYQTRQQDSLLSQSAPVRSIDLSHNGNVVVVGVVGHTQTTPGHAQVYQWNQTHWNPMGSALMSNATTRDDFGRDVSLSADGTRVVVASRLGVWVFDYNLDQQDWIVDPATPIRPQHLEDDTNMAGRVALAKLNPNVLALSNVAGTPRTLHVYQYTTTTTTTGAWHEIGRFQGQAANSQLGLWSVVLSDGGSRVGTAYQSDSTVAPQAGLAQFWDFVVSRQNTSEWVPVACFYGQTANDRAGYQLSLSGTGQYAAVGYKEEDGPPNIFINRAGAVRVFQTQQPVNETLLWYNASDWNHPDNLTGDNSTNTTFNTTSNTTHHETVNVTATNDLGDYTIVRVGDINATFSDRNQPELQLLYNITANRSVSISLFDYDCQTPLDPVDILTIAANDTTPLDSDTHQLQLQIHVQEAQLYHSNIWTFSTNNNNSGTLAFCTQVQLADDYGVVRSTHTTAASVHVTLDQRFGLSATSNYTSTYQPPLDLAVSNATTDYSVYACSCNVHNQCRAAPQVLEPNSALRLCVKTNSSNVVVAQVPYLRLERNGVTTMTPIDPETGPNEFTSVQIINQTAVIVARLVSAFFEEEENDVATIDAIGEVFLEFATLNGRSLSVRNLQASRNVRFSTPILLQFDTPNTRPKFGIAIALLLAASVVALVLIVWCLCRPSRRREGGFKRQFVRDLQGDCTSCEEDEQEFEVMLGENQYLV